MEQYSFGCYNQKQRKVNDQTIVASKRRLKWNIGLIVFTLHILTFLGW